MRRLTLLLLVALLLFGAVNDVSAMIFGIRYSNLNQAVLPTFEDSDSRGRFGMFLGYREKNHDFVLGMDYDRHKTEMGDVKLYARRFSANIGYRYRLFPADKISAMKINPYLGLYFFKSYGKVEAENWGWTDEEIQFEKDMLNDSGGWLSLGGEYYFAPGFSMGCEGGVRYTKASSKATGIEIKITDYTTFASILMTFYWK